MVWIYMREAWVDLRSMCTQGHKLLHFWGTLRLWTWLPQGLAAVQTAEAQNLRSQEPDGYFLIGSILEDETKTSNLETLWIEIRHLPKKTTQKSKLTFLKCLKITFKERKFRDWKKNVGVGLYIKMSLTWQMGWEWGNESLTKSQQGAFTNGHKKLRNNSLEQNYIKHK